jgi:hypothetical protein
MVQLFIGDKMDNISDSLMALAQKLQTADDNTKFLFSRLLDLAEKGASTGLTVQEMQMIVIVGHQLAKNPEIRKMYEVMFNMTAFNPNDTFH